MINRNTVRVHTTDEEVYHLHLSDEELLELKDILDEGKVRWQAFFDSAGRRVILNLSNVTAFLVTETRKVKAPQ